ncbi:hypothetical protein BTZ20_1486 [Rhodococcus sp. MTM3W5.2]|nr:hypothetical protein BTZ20_1486 [Rhodococcus sp. MTM3W5.2]
MIVRAVIRQLIALLARAGLALAEVRDGLGECPLFCGEFNAHLRMAPAGRVGARCAPGDQCRCGLVGEPAAA